MSKNKPIFITHNPLGDTVTCYSGPWYGHIVASGKHKELSSEREKVKSTVETPDKIFVSSESSDRRVYFKPKSLNSSLYIKVVTMIVGSNQEEVVTAFTTKKISGGIANEIYHK